MFALYRTANSIGIILTSATLSLISLVVTQAVSATLIFMATLTVGIASFVRRSSRPLSG